MLTILRRVRSTPDIVLSIAGNVKWLRLRESLSVRDLSELVAIPEERIMEIEELRAEPFVGEFVKLAAAFGADLESFTHNMVTDTGNPETSQKLKSIDLFAGIGGIRMGFDQAFGEKIETVFVSEWDPYAQKTYAANFFDFQPINGDITKIDEKSIPEFDICLAA